jgi:hypothetical protein
MDAIKKLKRYFCAIFPVLLAMPIQAQENCCGDGRIYRHQKTSGALPANAPLPDIEIPQGDSISAKAAYKQAKECLANRQESDAAEYFERAIGALRKRPNYAEKPLIKQIIVDYSSLLQTHMGAEKAARLQNEFL